MVKIEGNEIKFFGSSPGYISCFTYINGNPNTLVNAFKSMGIVLDEVYNERVSLWMLQKSV